MECLNMHGNLLDLVAVQNKKAAWAAFLPFTDGKIRCRSRKWTGVGINGTAARCVLVTARAQAVACLGVAGYKLQDYWGSMENLAQ